MLIGGSFVFGAITLSQNIQLGSGTPALTLNGDDLYVTGTFEVDGISRFDATSTFNSDLVAKTGGGATFIVAASDASARMKNQADYVADGTADDVQIQAAIDALPAVGGKVVLSEGNFTLAAGLELGDNTTLAGMGDGTKLIFATSVGDVTMITNKDSTPGSRDATGNFRITVRDMYIDGDKENRGTGTVTTWTVGFNTVDTLRIENLTVVNGWTTAIRTGFCTNVLIGGNRIHNSGDDGIAINEETYYATVINNIISDAGRGTNTFGVPIGIELQDGAHDVSVVGNTIRNPIEHAIALKSPASSVAPYNVSITGNVMEGPGTVGINLWPTAGVTTPLNSVIANNNVISGFDRGIRVNYVDHGVIVEDNLIYNSNFQGIEILENAFFVKVMGNYIYNSGLSAAASQIGIAIGQKSVKHGAEKIIAVTWKLQNMPRRTNSHDF